MSRLYFCSYLNQQSMTMLYTCILQMQRGLFFLDVRQKTEHRLLFWRNQVWSRNQVFQKDHDFVGFLWPSSVSSTLIHCSSSVFFFSDSIWLPFKAKKLPVWNLLLKNLLTTLLAFFHCSLWHNSILLGMNDNIWENYTCIMIVQTQDQGWR